MSHHGHHGGHSHGNMISANIGDQVAAGGAGHMNSHQHQQQYWDRWTHRGMFAGLWQFGLLILLFLIIAAVPVFMDHYLASMGEQPAPSEESVVNPAPPVSPTPTPAASSYAPQVAQPSDAWSQTPGYEPDFGRPTR